MKISRVYTALFATALAAMALPTAASAGCYNCYAPPQPCATCYQRQVVPPQYRAVQETVMVAPGGTIALPDDGIAAALLRVGDLAWDAAPRGWRAAIAALAGELVARW